MTPRQLEKTPWVTKILARRTYTSIASRASLLGILPITLQGVPRNDLAMNAAGVEPKAMASYGGIDLDDSNLKIDVKVDGSGVPLPIQFQDAAMVNIQGLVPAIRSIVPMTRLNIPVLFGLTAAGEE